MGRDPCGEPRRRRRDPHFDHRPGRDLPPFERVDAAFEISEARLAGRRATIVTFAVRSRQLRRREAARAWFAALYERIREARARDRYNVLLVRLRLRDEVYEGPFDVVRALLGAPTGFDGVVHLMAAYL